MHPEDKRKSFCVLRFAKSVICVISQKSYILEQKGLKFDPPLLNPTSYLFLQITTASNAKCEFDVDLLMYDAKTHFRHYFKNAPF